MERHIFICYQHEDSDFAQVLINRVEKAGFHTWIDDNQLRAGEDWRTGIDQAIKDAFALIVIMSPKAKASEYVTYEWAFAWGAGVKVIPVLYKETPLHPRLDALQYLNFTDRVVRPWDTLINTLTILATTSSHSSTLPAQNTLPSPSNTTDQNRVAWLDVGKLFFERKEYEEALDAYRQALFLDPNNAQAYVGRSRSLHGLKRYKEALLASEQALRLDPNNAEAYVNKGEALYGLKRYEEALAAYEQALRLDPSDAVTYNNKGNVLNNLERYEEALAAYEQTLRLDPSDASVYNNKGNVLKQLRRGKEAQQAYNRAKQLGYNG
jgi:tetratricopeptide (TPR) repeat protein